MTRYTRITAPPALITLAEAAAQVGATTPGADDARLQGCIDAAVGFLDGYDGVLGRAILTQTWRMDLPAAPALTFSMRIRIDLPIVQSVSSVTFADDAGSATVSGSIWTLDFDNLGAFVRPREGMAWSSLSSASGRISIEFIAGYGSTAPPALKSAALLGVASLWQLGGHQDIGAVFDSADDVGSTRYDRSAVDRTLNEAIGRLIAPYRRAFP